MNNQELMSLKHELNELLHAQNCAMAAIRDQRHKASALYLLEAIGARLSTLLENIEDAVVD